MVAVLTHDEPFDETAWIHNLPTAYRDWNDALAEYFFPESAAGRPVYLAVDADTLAEIAELHGWPSDTAAHNFAAAVNAAVRGKGYRSVLGPMPGTRDYQFYAYQWCEHQACREAPPPFIALLGLAVLAASNMRNSASVSAANYYHRLEELLPGYRHAKQSYQYVVAGWKALNSWLDVTNKGGRGKSTARPNPHLTKIGYALSQSLLREHDRRQLPAFFRWANLEPEDPLSAADLVPLLQRWSESSSCRLSRHGCAHLRNPSLQQAIAEVALDELRAWTGDLETRDEPETQRGPRSRIAPAFLLLKPGRGRRVGLTLIPRRLDGFPDQLALETSTIRAIDVTGWYEPIGISEPFGPVEWRTADRRFGIRFDPPPVIALIEDADLDHWRQVNRLRFDQEAIVLAAPDARAKVEKVLEATALPGWRDAEVVGLPPGWAAYIDVRIARPIESPDPDLACLSPLALVGASLSGGLRLDRDTWLVGGAPTVNVRKLVPDGPIDVRLDGDLVHTLPADGGTFDLELVSPQAGRHRLEVGSVVLELALREGRRSPRLDPNVSPIVVPLRRFGSTFVPADRSERRCAEAGPPGIVRIRGAEVIALASDASGGEMSDVACVVDTAPAATVDVDFTPRTLELRPCAVRIALLGRRPGEIVVVDGHRHQTYPPPRWDRCTPARVTVPFAPQWLVQQSAAGAWSIEPMKPVLPPGPIATGAPESDLRAWSRHVCRGYSNLADAGARALLAAYKRAGEPFAR